MKKIIIHPDYKSLEKHIVDVSNNFDKNGKIVFNGRNVIKSFELHGTVVNVKRFKVPNAFNSFVYKHIRDSKAKRSYDYAYKLQNLGILTPKPIAYIEETDLLGLKNSYYFSEHVVYDLDFRVLIHNPKYLDRETILQQFTEFTFNLHEKGINFLDHSPGNTLIVNKGDDKYDFYLIDLNRMKFESMDLDKRMHNFRRLWLSKTMIRVMAKTYANLYGETYESTYNLMLKYSRAFQLKIDRKKLRKSGRRPRFALK